MPRHIPKTLLLLPMFFLLSLPSEQTRTVAEQEFIDFQTRAMWVLSSWSAANLLYSAVAVSVDTEYESFHQMNAAWVMVNLGISVPALIRLRRSGLSDKQRGDLLAARHDFSKVLSLNTGLNVSYLTSGLFMRELHESDSMQYPETSEQGGAILLQGAFLFVFDLILLLKNEKEIKTLEAL